MSTKNKKNKDTADQKPGVKPPFHPITSDTKWTECYDSKPYDLDYPLYPPGTNSPLDWANLGDLKNNSDGHSEDNSENQTDMSFSAFVVPTGEMSTRGKAKKLRDFANYSPFQFMNDNNEIGASGASCSSTYNSNSNYDTNIKNKRNIPNCHSILKNEDGNTHLKSEKREKFSVLDINSDSHGRLPFPQNKKIKTEKKVSYIYEMFVFVICFSIVLLTSCIFLFTIIKNIIIFIYFFIFFLFLFIFTGLSFECTFPNT